MIGNDTFWYKENTDIYHKEDGPAIEYYTGEKVWYKDGKCHRIEGPAVQYGNGTKQYWLDNIWYPDVKTDEEWIIFQIIN